mmetsp:Transcript_82484/g.164847  ORF Transcript_82484/g.164847 Transcript_82484/m.164847 type:complete len:205 (-) Transcript_82484:174-788(-)
MQRSLQQQSSLSSSATFSPVVKRKRSHKNTPSVLPEFVHVILKQPAIKVVRTLKGETKETQKAAEELVTLPSEILASAYTSADIAKEAMRSTMKAFIGGTFKENIKNGGKGEMSQRTRAAKSAQAAAASSSSSSSSSISSPSAAAAIDLQKEEESPDEFDQLTHTFNPEKGVYCNGAHRSGLGGSVTFRLKKVRLLAAPPADKN